MEFWDIYDKNRNRTGRLQQRGLPMPPDDYHLSVMVWIFDPDGRVLLTRRHPKKPWGGFWECTGGAATAGEDSSTAAIREVAEEIGLDLQAGPKGLLVRSWSRRADSPAKYSSFYDAYLFIRKFPLSSLCLQPEEVTDARWVSRLEYQKMQMRREIVPTLDDPFPFWDALSDQEKIFLTCMQ